MKSLRPAVASRELNVVEHWDVILAVVGSRMKDQSVIQAFRRSRRKLIGRIGIEVDQNESIND